MRSGFLYLARVVISILLLLFHTGCERFAGQQKNTLFESVSPEISGVTFKNVLTFDHQFNIYTYRNFYNGGGVALGDVNNDGLLDIYFTANQGSNKLYLNKGDFQFEDITEQAGMAGNKAWSTGVSMVDVNGDGWLDIYVCNSGDVEGDDKENELFINNGDLTFTDRAKEWGVDDRGYTTHAVFFDYDRDGDLDLYILNNSYQAIGSFNLQKNERPKRDSLGGDKLLMNENGKFIDVSEEAGIFGSIIGFGLGVTVGDINKDGWPDIYVSNDFFERDYLYINNTDGTFKECLTEEINSVSAASMGADLADINNDGWSDIFVTDMLPFDYGRLKTVTTFDNWDRYQYGVKNGYHHQFTRNTLQVNNGNNTFSELGRLAGVEATDWSWGALIFDMDNDGLKDIFVANGIYQDLTNQDYLQYISNEEVIRSIVSENGVDYQKLVELIPSNPISNFAFQNNGNIQFTNITKSWGLDSPGFSNGSAYGDLDNDGDLDLVINNVNETASLFRNHAKEILPNNRSLQFELVGDSLNRAAFGASIIVSHKEHLFYIEQMPNRGFQSSVDPRPVIGLGAIDTVERIVVQWPYGTITELFEVPTDQLLTLNIRESKIDTSSKAVSYNDPLFKSATIPGLELKHTENDFVDFDRDKLLFHMLSNEGPRVSKGDINGDGLVDLFIGGARDIPGKIFIQVNNGVFKEIEQRVFVEDRLSEDQGNVLFDADADGDLDLYVCSGGNEFSTSSSALSDRLYFNDGKGNFSRSSQLLPTKQFESSSVVKVTDFNGDGHLDLFVGIRCTPFKYGVPVSGYLLQNNGLGFFEEVTERIAPDLKNIGMITDATWADVDLDGDDDLVLVGEYMPMSIFLNESGKFINRTESFGLSDYSGWWNRVAAADLNGDGYVDFVVGNHGLNSRFKASPSKPITMYVNDFDKNGTMEQIICMYYEDKDYPIVLRHDLTSQIPSLKKKYLKYENFKDQKIESIFDAPTLAESIVLRVNLLQSGVFMNDGSGKFIWRSLPIEAQYSPVYAIHVSDFDKDGFPDLLLGGNLHRAKPEVGRYDASYGLYLRGDGKGGFTAIKSEQSGVKFDGEVRDYVDIDIGGNAYLLVIRNNEPSLLYRIDGNE